MDNCKSCNKNNVDTWIRINHPHVNREIGLCNPCVRAKARGWLKIEVQARRIVFIDTTAATNN